MRVHGALRTDRLCMPVCRGVEGRRKKKVEYVLFCVAVLPFRKLVVVWGSAARGGEIACVCQCVARWKGDETKESRVCLFFGAAVLVSLPSQWRRWWWWGSATRRGEAVVFVTFSGAARSGRGGGAGVGFDGNAGVLEKPAGVVFK